MRLLIWLLVDLVGIVLACDFCDGAISSVLHERYVRRMQPGAQNATVGPRAPLEWGQLNVLHTTDTHGWLEGHLKEHNYGADWGDFVSFQKHMKAKARSLGVDLLLVDTGDLHDGNGLSDAALPNGVLSNPIFDEVDYDLLAIGNHELYVSEIAYEHFENFSKFWGDKYVTSNVQIINPATGQFEYIGAKYRYFTTENGLRILAFGVIFDFTSNSNISRITKGADMVKEQWFLDAVNFAQPIDLFLLIGHNPIRTNVSTSTFGLLHQTIRSMRPEIPIQAFGGHTHIRDFQVYDDRSTGLESGRYCETLGWLSMSGINSSTFTGIMNPQGVPNPSRKATNTSTSGLVYSRRYLDWNRLTFAYHATDSQDTTFDLESGLRVTKDITAARRKLNLNTLYGCAPATYCISCAPFASAGNIFSIIPEALAATVINASRADVPRYIILNTGSIRFDLVKGPFTYDDSFIVSPFVNQFVYIPSVPYVLASQILDKLNEIPANKKREQAANLQEGLGFVKDLCEDPTMSSITGFSELKTRSLSRRQMIVSAGYVTTDDFGIDGDDTPHSNIPHYPQPDYLQANASFSTASTPPTVDVVFLNFVAANMIAVLNAMGGTYTSSDVNNYLPANFTSQTYLPEYAKIAWQANVPNCPVG